MGAGACSPTSAWKDHDALGAFVHALPHRAVVAKLRPHMGATRFVSWTLRDSELPLAWDDATARLAGAAASGPRGR